MKKSHIVFAVLVFAILIGAPGFSLAQSGQPAQIPTDQGYAVEKPTQVNPDRSTGPPTGTNQNQSGQTGSQVPQPKGGIATVIGVDQPENCLRIRSGPGSSYEVIGCADMGQQLNISGVWTSNEWAQLAEDAGWVYGRQVYTDLRPDTRAYSQARNYVVEEEYPVETYSYLDSYLPDYGYQTYWYGGIPLILYDVNVWRKFHPWWRHARNHKWDHRGQARIGTERNFSGQDRGDRRFRQGARTFDQNRSIRQSATAGAERNLTNRALRQNTRIGTQGNVITNRSNLSSPNVRRFSSENFRSRTFNAPRSGANLSGSSSFRSGPSGTRQFSASPSSGFNAGARMGSSRIGSGGGGGSSGATRMGGGGGGGGARMGGGGGGGARFSGGGGGRRRRSSQII